MTQMDGFGIRVRVVVLRLEPEHLLMFHQSQRPPILPEVKALVMERLVAKLL